MRKKKQYFNKLIILFHCFFICDNDQSSDTGGQRLFSNLMFFLYLFFVIAKRFAVVIKTSDIIKKGVLLNSEVSSVIARLGHTDQVVVCDAGLPIPATTARVDLALTHNVPIYRC